jgi:hypothetical protein
MEGSVENADFPVPSPIELLRRVAALAGLSGMALASAGWTLYPYAFWRAYFFAWLFAASATLGCAALAGLTRAVHGSAAGLSVWTAGARTAPLVTVLALPLALSGDEPLRWMLALAATRSAAGLACLIGATCAISALSLALLTLALLTRQEPALLATAYRLRAPLTALLATDALLVLTRPSAIEPSVIATVVELGVVVALVWTRGPRVLATLAAVALAARAVALHGVVFAVAALPGESRWRPHALDLLLLVALGGLWLALFLWRLDREPPPPLRRTVDPVAGA